jgi:hypothetical protein
MRATHLVYSVSRDPAKGVLYLKLVNSSSAPESLHVTLDGLQSVKSTAKLTVLTAEHGRYKQHHRAQERCAQRVHSEGNRERLRSHHSRVHHKGFGNLSAVR